MDVRFCCNAGKQPVNNVAFVGTQLSAGRRKTLQTNFQAAFQEERM